MAATTPWIIALNNWSSKSLAEWQVPIPYAPLGSYRYGDEYDDTRLLAANDGSIVIVADLWIGKYSSEGIQQWIDTLGHSESGEFLIDIAVGEGVVALIGSVDTITIKDYKSPGTVDSLDQVSTRDSLDNLYALSGNEVALLQRRDDGENYILTGSLFNEDGANVWTATFLTQWRGSLLPEGLTATADNLYAYGRRWFPGSNPNQYLFVERKSTKDNSSWTASLGYTDDDLILSVLPTGADSSAYVIGATRGTGTGNIYGNSDGILVSRISSTGNTEWTKTLQDSITERHIVPTAAHASRDGSLYVAYQHQIIKILGNGTEEWSLAPYIIYTEFADGSKSRQLALLPLDSPVPYGVTLSSDGPWISRSYGMPVRITEISEDSKGSLYLAVIAEEAVEVESDLQIQTYAQKLYLASFSDPGKILRQPPDTIPPTLRSTTATSNQLILTFSEDIQIAGGGSLNPAYMTVIVDGQTRKVTRSQITPPDHPTIHTAYQLVLTLFGRALDSAKSISVSYNPPSNTTTSGFITDLSGNSLPSIATQVVDTFSTSTNINKSGIASAYKNLILTGSAPITGYGNTQNNTITGNDANNTLDGLAGADTMIGGLGNDTYFVDNVGDVVTEVASEGIDTVQSTITYTLADNVENLTLLGSGAINGTGNTANNILTGNAGANVLNGNGGTDTLIGGRGNDTYIVDSAGDIITESGSSSDIDSVQSSVSWLLGNNLENLTLTGSSAINGTGNNLNNIIIGNSANNILDGGNGGTDRLTGLTGADIFRFSTRPSSFRNSSADHITDFSSTQGDKIQITKSAFGITASTATLSVVSSANALTTALSGSSMFVYETSSGELHWNQNGISRGAGSGGVLAILDNKASLSAGDLVLV